MNLRVILIAAGLVGLLFGSLFLLGAEPAIRSFNPGESSVPARLFARSLGAAVIAISIINLLAAGDRGSIALRAIVAGNIVIHVLSFIVDFTETYVRVPGAYVGLAVHVVFTVAFVWVLLNWSSLTQMRPARG